MIGEVIEKFLGQKEFLDNYLSILGIVAIVAAIAYILAEIKDKSASGVAMFMLFIKQFPMALLVVMGLYVVVIIPAIVAFTFFDYIGDLLESIGASFLSLPVTCLIIIGMFVGSIWLYRLFDDWRDKHKIKKPIRNLDTKIAKIREEVNGLRLEIKSKKEEGLSTWRLDERLTTLSERQKILEDFKEEERKEGLNNNGQ